jgi:hypothetical protein
LSLLLVLVWLVLGLSGHGHAVTAGIVASEHSVAADHSLPKTVSDSHHQGEDTDRGVCAGCPEHSDTQCCCGFGHCFLALPLAGAGHWLAAAAPRPRPIAQPPLAAEPPGQPVRPPIA